MARIFKRIKNRFLRIGLFIFCILFLIVALTIVFISPIAKRIITELCEKSLHRKVTIGLFYFNPFTGHIYAHNFLMYERESTDTFLNAAEISCNVQVRAFFKKTLNSSSFKINKLQLNVIQDSTVVNFQDLLVHDSTNKQKPLQYCIKNIEISNSEVHYHERIIPVTYYIKDVNIKCPLIEWDVDTMYYEYNFKSGPASGTVKGNVTLNVKTEGYRLVTQVSHFDLQPMEQYVKDFSRYGKFSAFLDANIHSIGNFSNKYEMMTKGDLAITDFRFGREGKEDYLTFRKFSLNIDSLSPANEKYFFSAVVLDSPYIKYEKYDTLDNFSLLVGVGGANIKEAKEEHESINIIFLVYDYLKDIAYNIVNSQYHLDKLDISHARILYRDYSLLETFSVTVDPIKITGRNMNTQSDRMYFNVDAQLYPFGDIDVKVDLDPKGFGDFNMNYAVTNLPLPLFNPYMITSTAHPFHEGDMELRGHWHVANKQVKGNNHLIIINPTLADKVKHQGVKKLPMGIITWFVRNWHRTIDIEIPITGDLNNPTYHYSDVIFDALKNLFVKPPIFPYTQTVHKEKKKKDKYALLEWIPRQVMLNDDQEDQLRKISHYISSHDKANLKVSPVYYESREKEAILFYEAKKRFYLDHNHKKAGELTVDDSIAISEMSVKDSTFVRYLDRFVNKNKDEFTVVGKCRRLISSAKVNSEYNEMLEARKKAIMKYFADKEVADRVNFEKGVSTVPASGYSHYDFDYEGEKPDAVDDNK